MTDLRGQVVSAEGSQPKTFEQDGPRAPSVGYELAWGVAEGNVRVPT